MKLLSIIFTFLIIILGAVFAILNAEPVSIKLYIGQMEPYRVALSLALIIAFALGAIAGILAASMIILKLKRANSKLDKEHKAIELKNSGLKNISGRELS